jgi:endonuclease/exonuclease/phosphatase family metal-dependent hydrolase
MPFYNDLRPADDFKRRDYELIFPQMTLPEKRRTIEKLLLLKEDLNNAIAPRRTDKNLIVASWNIKEFGHTTQRIPESYFYIAEILSSFDLIAIQEIKSSLDDLYIIMRLLGDDWGYLVNDITEGDSGNSERSCYIFNKKRVQLAGLAGEIVLWDDITRFSTLKQLKRTPYITGFTAGWKTFAMINLHLHPGQKETDIAYRREEVTLLLKALAEKKKRSGLWSENLICVGDFNFYDGMTRDDPTIQIIRDAGFDEVSGLAGLDTNVSKTNAYDRFFLSKNDYFTLRQNDVGLDSGGVFDPFNTVFTIGEAPTYASYMIDDYTGSKDMTEPANQSSYFKHPWRKNQLSDHFPIWFELIIDSSPLFLRNNLKGL